jgi:N-acetylglucosaminyldiphosphoundecaprenol N-acetyl-beta-D-mannosaminyltransferase
VTRSEVSLPTSSVPTRVRVGTIAIDALRFEEAIDAIADMVTRGEGGTVFTPNVDHVVVAERDSRLREAYSAADLSLVDGVPVLWAASVLGTPLPEKISGSDLFLPLVARAAHCGWRVYLLGGRDGVAQRAKEILEGRYPGLSIVGTGSPTIDLSKGLSEQEDVLAAVRAARPHLLFLALGAPKQEIWAYRTRDVLRPAVMVCVGAALDFVAGVAKRAPRWMSAAGLEWLFRLAQEPKRMSRRYLLRDPQFAAIVARQWWQR